MSFNENEPSDFQLELWLGGEAMSEPYDIAHTLRELADRLESRGLVDGDGYVLDRNGNSCGQWRVDYPERDDDE